MTESGFVKLCEVVARLRGPDGCPWDREQTNASLLPPLIEEAYEVAGAVEAADDVNLREELGDLIMLAVMHAQIAQEQKRFDINEVLSEVTAKLVRRHPHVFATSDARDADAVLKQWEAIKRKEKGGSDAHYLGNVSTALPALMRAQKVQNKVARVNFDWSEISDVVAKVEEEFNEAKAAIATHDDELIAEELGDLLFAVVNLVRKNKLDAETIMRAATDKFMSRFNRLEDELNARGRSLGEPDLEELDAIWNTVKADAKPIGVGSAARKR